MSELHLVRFRDFTRRELAPGLFYATNLSQLDLAPRYSPGTVRRLGMSAAIATENIDKAIKQDDLDDLKKNGKATYAVISKTGESDSCTEIVGAATIIAGLKLFSHHVPLKPVVTDRISYHRIRTEVLLGNANVTGWTTPDHMPQLSNVYKRLLDEVPAPYSSWTIEPTAASVFIHAAIEGAGMKPVGPPDHYDVGEDRDVTIPRSQAYFYDHVS